MIELLLLGLIVWAVVAAVRRRDRVGGPADDGFAVRRVFQYLMLFVALIVAAIGVTGVLGSAISTADARRDVELAGPLAMTIVAVPAFVGLLVWVLRTHGEDRTERETPAWSFYLNAALVVTLSVAVVNAIALADRLIDGVWRGGAAAALLVWAGAWVGHWLLWRRLRPDIGPNVQLWLGSTIGLWVAAVALGFVVLRVVQRIFDSGIDVGARGGTEGMGLAAVAAGIGLAVWGWHWLLHGLRADRSGGWYVCVLLCGVFAGLTAAVAAGGYGLYLVLEWIWGEPDTSSALVHYRELASPVAAVVIGLGSWIYHRSIVGPPAERIRTEVHRAYDYIVSAVALGAVAVAITILVIALFTTITPASAAGEDAGINTLLAAVTFLAVGAPMWFMTWRRIQTVTAGNEEEIRSTSRRTYLFAILGTGGAVAFGALIALLVVIFQAMLGERDGGALASDLDIPVALLITTGVIAAYHWIVYRAERRVAPKIPTRDVLFVGDGVVYLEEIAARTHTRIRTLHRLDLEPGAQLDVDEVVRAIENTAGAHLLVLAGNHEVEVVPYE